jgi:hypothetical protein
LDPLKIAESELRFVEVDSDDLKADFHDLIDLLRAENEDEQNLNAAVTSLNDQLQKIANDVPDLGIADLESVRNDAVPVFQQQIEEIKKRHENAEQNRQQVKREWLPNLSVADLQQLVDNIAILTADELQKRQASAAWLEKKNEIDQQLLTITAANEEVLQRYADNLEPASVQKAEEDLQGLSNLSDKLRQAKLMLQNALDWLMSNKEMPEEERRNAAEKLDAELKRIDHEESALNALTQKLEAELQRQKEMDSRVLQIQQEIGDLQNELLTIHQEQEDPVQKQVQVDEIQTRLQPLLQEVNSLQKQQE